MKILVIGRGGREHSIVMHLKKSHQVSEIFVAPGNDGMKKDATIISIDEMNFTELVKFAREKQIDLTIVGPENPLNAGIANEFSEHGLRIFAPNKEAAILEGSKAFAKEFMINYQIPTASYATFTDPTEAKNYIEKQGAPIVIKADGLAEGKGVTVATTKEEALSAIDLLMVEGAFSGAGKKIVIEEFLDGREFSLIAFVHEQNVFPMIPARDHKRAFDGDQGPNTGGMGAFAPVPDITDDIINYATKEILQKAADGLMKENRPFTGILYAGLIQTEEGTKVIEFNTRFGDPETQVVLPLLENNLEQVMIDVMDGKDPKLSWKNDTCIGVVVASKGYPQHYEKGIPLPKIENNDELFIVNAGVKFEGDKMMSNGGRVLLVGATGKTIELAKEKVYHTLTVFDHEEAFFYRKDIANT